MKKQIYLSIITVLLLTVFFSDASAQWRRLIDRPTYDMWANEKNYNTLFCGGEGRLVYRSYDAGATWDTLIVGNHSGGPAQFNNIMMSKTDTNVVIVGGLVFGDIRRSTNHGQTWDISLLRTHALSTNGKAIVRDEKNPNTIYFGDYKTAKIFRSDNFGETWDSVTTVMRNFRIWSSDTTYRDTIMKVNIGSLGIREDSTNILFCNTTDGLIFMSKDYGYNWDLIDTLVIPGIDPSDCEITRLLFSRRDSITGYAVITYLFGTNKPNGGLYKTTDGGYNWDLLSFADTSMWAVSARPYGNNDEVFIGGYTENYFDVDENYVPGAGIVRRSLDGGKTWYAYDEMINWTIERPKSSAPLLNIEFFNTEVGIAVGHYGNIFLRKPGQKAWDPMTIELTYDFEDVSIADESTAYVVGRNGIIVKSIDVGETWVEIPAEFKDDIYAVKFFNPEKGIIAGESGMIKITNDSAKTWTDIESEVDDDILDIVFTNDLNGYACGKKGLFVRTTNGGITWEIIDTDIDEEFKRISAVGNRVMIPLNGGNILLSNDGGNNWTVKQTGEDFDLNAISMLNENKAWTAGHQSEAFSTEDGGENWEFIDMNSFRHIYDVTMINDTLWAACGQYTTIWLTYDAGENWYYERIGSGPRSNMWSLRYFGDPGEEKLYMASEAGLFVLDEPSDVKSNKESSDSRLNVVISPANTMMVFYNKFDQYYQGEVSFRVIDINGRVVMERSLPPNSSPEIRANLRLPNLPSGAYICQTIEGDHATTAKIIINN